MFLSNLSNRKVQRTDNSVLRTSSISSSRTFTDDRFREQESYFNRRSSPDSLASSWSPLASTLRERSRHTLDALDDNPVRWIRSSYLNLNNVQVSWAFHPNRWEKSLAKGLPHPTATFSSCWMFDILLPESGLSSVGEVIFMPDKSTIKSLPYHPGHAMVLGDFVEGTEPFDLCPRTILKRQVDEMQRQHGLKPVVGFEVEFILFDGFDNQGHPRPLDSFSYMNERSFLSRGGACVEEIVDTLTEMDIEVFTWHAESSSGQYEISLAPAEVVKACDDLVYTRQVIYAIAAKHNLSVTLAPKVFADEAGSGQHIHISLIDSNGANVFPDCQGMSTVCKQFLAGVLEHLRAIAFISMPTVNSFARLQPGSWAGGTMTTWGYENREAACRVASPPYGQPCNNIEFRPADSTGNCYLTLAAYLMAGMDGMTRQLHLGPDLKGDASHLSVQELEKLNAKPMPKSLLEALEAFDKDQVLSNGFGERFKKVMFAMKRYELQHFKGLNETEALRQILERF